jgi:uncharacterized membrane protein YphA (DoxX/SURF4 family)
MTWRTSLFLVLLQLAIGVHLLYEGVWKLHHPSWTSEGYLRGATGPLALPIRWLAGDPDVTWKDDHLVAADSTADFVARFTVKPFNPNEAASDRRWHEYMPPSVEAEWDAYFDKFVQQYKLNDPENKTQLDQARIKFTTAKNDFVKWLTEGTKKKAPPYFLGPAADFPKKTPDRVQEYLKKLQEVRDLETQEMGTFGPKLAAKLTRARDEAKAMKKDLQEDLEDQTAQMKTAVREVLTYEQKRMASVPEEAKPKATWSRLPWIDQTVRYGLVVVGAGLLLGLFTRLACLGGVLLLLLFYLAMPPWPGVPESPAPKGHYLFVNENIIESLALLVIATSRPGSRYGLDAWLPFHRLRRRHGEGAAPDRDRNLHSRETFDR